jgi:hypothetical protein
MESLMSDPILDKSSLELEAFREESVQEYLSSKQNFTKFPRRHYSQTEVGFDTEEVRRQIERIDVPIKNTRVTVFGGYTGQFALSLKMLGLNVVFTDPLEEWVSNAKRLGIEAYKYSAQEIPRELLDRTDLFATFECYPVMIGNNKLWVFLRMLTAKMGVMFIESQRTFNEMREEQKCEGIERSTRLKSDFLPFARVYQVNRQQRSRRGSELVFYHVVTEKPWRQLMLRDWRTLKALHDSLPHGSMIEEREIRHLATELGLDEGKTKFSVQRLFLLYRLNQGVFGRTYSKLNEFDVFSKSYFLEPSCIPPQALELPPLTAEAFELLKRFRDPYIET